MQTYTHALMAGGWGGTELPRNNPNRAGVVET